MFTKVFQQVHWMSTSLNPLCHVPPRYLEEREWDPFLHILRLLNLSLVKFVGFSWYSDCRRHYDEQRTLPKMFRQLWSVANEAGTFIRRHMISHKMRLDTVWMNKWCSILKAGLLLFFPVSKLNQIYYMLLLWPVVRIRE